MKLIGKVIGFLFMVLLSFMFRVKPEPMTVKLDKRIQEINILLANRALHVNDRIDLLNESMRLVDMQLELLDQEDKKES